jgi:hypothetical protein
LIKVWSYKGSSDGIIGSSLLVPIVKRRGKMFSESIWCQGLFLVAISKIVQPNDQTSALHVSYPFVWLTTSGAAHGIVTTKSIIYFSLESDDSNFVFEQPKSTSFTVLFSSVKSELINTLAALISQWAIPFEWM